VKILVEIEDIEATKRKKKYIARYKKGRIYKKGKLVLKSKKKSSEGRRWQSLKSS